MKTGCDATMKRITVPRRILQSIFCGILSFTWVFFSAPVVSSTVVPDPISLVANSSFEIKRSKIDDVLDSYSYFHCYADPSHDIKVLEPTYRTLTYRNGYTRKYPDAQLYVIYQYPCPTDPTHNGLLKRFACSYETY